LIWSKIRRKSLGYEFHRQVPIGRYIVDFYCHELMLAIEIDGTSHDNKKAYDNFRQKSLESQGVVFLRFENKDINNHMNEVLRILEQAITALESKSER
jgi:very-short-patch-repair endonuclease